MSPISSSPLPFTLPSASITGTGMYVPEKILTNHDLEKIVDTSDEWITSRTGIKERRIANEEESVSEMGARASLQAMKSSGVKSEEIDYIIVATCTPETVFPSTACHIQRKIGALNASAFDLSAACSGFLYALEIAESFIARNSTATVLVVGSEKISSIVDWKDRNTCVLFGDGAGAAIVQNRPESRGIISSITGADGRQNEILSLQSPCPASPFSKKTKKEKLVPLPFMEMRGKEVYKHAVTTMNEAAEKSLKKSGLRSDQISCVIPHQANMRIIESVADRLKMPMEKFFINLEKYGNVSAASIPIALHEAHTSQRIHRGDILLFVVFGAGLTWASMVIEW